MLSYLGKTFRKLSTCDNLKVSIMAVQTQSAHNWNAHLHQVLTSMNFTCCQADCAVYIFSWGKVQILAPIFIDDITLMGMSPAANDKVVKEMKHHFKLHNLGPTKFLLRIHISHDIPTRPPHYHNVSTLSTSLNTLGCLTANQPSSPWNPTSHWPRTCKQSLMMKS